MRRYAISHSALLGGVERLPEWVAWLDAQGVEMVQIREKQLSARSLAGLVERCVARARSIRILVNTRADIALACGAHGVHLPGGAPAPALWRRIAPSGFLIGVSCHGAEECAAAAREGADFAVISPVFAPLSKVTPEQPLGLDRLARICRATGLPLYALGGVDAGNAAACCAAGAAGVAGITQFLPHG
jgi:thiamine-phosphate pyrophosphorylase